MRAVATAAAAAPRVVQVVDGNSGVAVAAPRQVCAGPARGRGMNEAPVCGSRCRQWPVGRASATAGSCSPIVP